MINPSFARKPVRQIMPASPFKKPDSYISPVKRASASDLPTTSSAQPIPPATATMNQPPEVANLPSVEQPSVAPSNNQVGALGDSLGNNQFGALASQMTALKQASMAEPVQRELPIQPKGMNNFQQFDDRAYSQISKRLDHQFEGERKTFDQRMVNQGLAAGTEAYDNALKNFDQNKADTYDSARMSAMNYALKAQHQDFGQRMQSRGLDLQDKYSSLSNALSRSGIGENQRQFDAGFGFNQNQAQFGNAMNLANFNENKNRWNNTNNFSQFVAMDGINRAYNDQSYRDTVFNASRQDQQYNQLVSALRGGMPQQGVQPIDTMGAYNMNQNAAMNQYNSQMQQAQSNQASFNNLIGTGATAFMLSSRNYKENGTPIDKHNILDAVNSLDIEEWNYKGEKRHHIGAYAEDFNEAIGNEVETDKISAVDAIGALMASVQVLTERVEELEGVVAP